MSSDRTNEYITANNRTLKFPDGKYMCGDGGHEILLIIQQHLTAHVISTTSSFLPHFSTFKLPINGTDLISQY